MSQAIAGPLVLIVLDGVGEIARETGNAVRLAHMPFYNRIKDQHRFTTLNAHGTFVGLPSDSDMGNSEVGHNALGAGQVYQQGAKLVQNAIADGALFQGETWQKAVAQVKRHTGCMHFLGLLSDGNVHSHIDHLLTLIDKSAEAGINRVRVHVLLDGRDVDATSAPVYVEKLEKHLATHNQQQRDFRIASGGGRMKITMDRYEADWPMVAKGWQTHVHGEGRQFASASQAIDTLRNENPGIIDQDLPPFVVADDRGPVGPIRDGDSLIFFNFRGDRAIEISRAFDEGEHFSAFDRGKKPDVFYAGMMQYDGDLPSPNHYLVGPPKIQHTMTAFLADQKVHQYAISETQKYGHVTYFWNGNRSGKVAPGLETYVEVPSDNLPFEQRPWMKAAEITDALIGAIAVGQDRFLRVNYANGDMVGHTGDLQAAIIAMSCLDWQLHRLCTAVEKAGGVAIITADHGNCDEMYYFDKQGQPTEENGRFKAKTSHTLSPVPFILFDPKGQVDGQLARSESMGLANVAATVTSLLGFQAPSQWLPSILQR